MYCGTNIQNYPFLPFLPAEVDEWGRTIYQMNTSRIFSTFVIRIKDKMIDKL